MKFIKVENNMIVQCIQTHNQDPELLQEGWHNLPDEFIEIPGSTLLNYYYWDGTTVVERPTIPSSDHQWNNVTNSWDLDRDRLNIRMRHQRDIYLRESDWSQFADNSLTDAKRAEWTTYRQALRDIPANNTTVATFEDIAWPTQPS